MADFYRELTRILTRAGWRYQRPGNSSHEIWTDQTGLRRLTVPRSSKSPHLMNEILKPTRPAEGLLT